MRSWILLIVLSAMLLLVAACSSDDDTTDDVPAGEDTATAEMQETPATEPESEPTETPEPEPTETPEPEPTETPVPEPESDDATGDVDDEEADADDSDPRATSQDTGELDGYLVNIDDLPEGWMQVDEDMLDDDEFGDMGDVSDDPFDNPCGIEPLGDSVEPLAEAERSFEGSELGPYFSQNLMQMESSSEAEEVMSTMRELFDCEEWTETDEFGDEITFTINEIPFEDAGDDAFAIELSLSFGELSEEESAMMEMFGDFSFDIVILQRNEFISMLMHFDLFGTGDTDFESLVRIADDKLQS